MRQKEFIDLFISISEKVECLGFDEDAKLKADVLHSSMAFALKDLTEEEYNKLPIYLRKTIEKLETKLLKYVSFDYKKDYEKHVQENGKFRKSLAQNRKCKQRIGFYEEGETVNKVD